MFTSYNKGVSMMCPLTSISKLENVAAQVLGCEPEDVRELKYDSYGLKIFSNGGEEYAIGSDEEATEAVRA